MPINNGVYKNVYIHENYNRNEIREFLLQGATHSTRPIVTNGQDKGLMYFDVEVGRIIVWDGTDWKVVRYFDDRDMESNDNINLQDIWGESNLVSQLTYDEAMGNTGSQTVAQRWGWGFLPGDSYGIVTSHIPGSWSFYTDDMESVIFPKTFDDGSPSYSTFFEPVVHTYLGATVSSDLYMINEYKVGTKTQYRIEFLDGAKMVLAGITTTNVPRISFFKYVGERLSLTYINGSINKYHFNGSDFVVDPNDSDRYRRNLTATGVTNIGQISTFSCNGQELSSSYHYTIYEESTIYYISLDISSSGTNWVNEGGIHSDDFFYLYTMNHI